MQKNLLTCAGLRALQGRKELDQLVKRVKAARDSLQWGPQGPPPLLVKLAPDLQPADKTDIAAVALKHGLDGLVVSNTTISRPPNVRDHPSGDEVSTSCLRVVHGEARLACGPYAPLEER